MSGPPLWSNGPGKKSLSWLYRVRIFLLLLLTSVKALVDQVPAMHLDPSVALVV